MGSYTEQLMGIMFPKKVLKKKKKASSSSVPAQQSYATRPNNRSRLASSMRRSRSRGQSLGKRLAAPTNVSNRTLQGQ